MKKNRMMRLASILLVLVLMTSSVVGGTFAKYTTSAESSDTARVAYWGFEKPTTVEFDLFGHSDSGVYFDGTNDLLAPGTTKTINYEFLNTKVGDRAPEVAYKVIVTTDGSVPPSQKLDDQITWIYNGTDCPTWDSFINAIKAESAEYNAGELPNFLKAGETNTIGWRWEFADGSDVEDTYLGNETELASVKLAIKITVEQMDTAPAANP